MLLHASILFFGCLVAGLAALFISPTERMLKMVLAFGGSFILGLSFFHLLPEAYSVIGTRAGVAVVIGFLMQVILESFSGGLEHGHFHGHSKGFPWVVFFGLSIHAFVEGLPFGEHHHDHGLWPLLVGVMLHKMPVAFVMGSMLKMSAVSNGRIMLAVVFFSLMAPIGAGIAGAIPTEITPNFFYIVIGVVVGMLLHISTTILYEADKGHKFNIMKTVIIVFALGLAYMASIL